MTKINFTNLPDTSTPINATNMNQLQINVENAINATQISLENEITALPGEIIESGSNANGEYIKFSNGTMICTKQVFITAEITSSWGNLYDTGNQDIDLGNYAQTFYSIPVVSITMSSANGCWLEGCSNRTTSSYGKIVLVSATSKTASVAYDLIAIGKWK